MVVVDLTEAMWERWSLSSPYPGDPYDHNEFGKFYSDHRRVVFCLARAETGISGNLPQQCPTQQPGLDLQHAATADPVAEDRVGRQCVQPLRGNDAGRLGAVLRRAGKHQGRRSG